MEGQSPAILSAGAVFHGKYEVRRCLKVGGMAVVYEVAHRVTRRPAALKVMLPEILSERGMRERFELEARVTAEIESDHIVEVLDAGLDGATGSAFLVMELLRGDDLESVLRRRGPLAEDRVVALLSQAASALDAVHRARIVHRDLKPSNLFLVEAEARPPQLKVLDFGIAKIVAGGALTTRNLGTPAYMSPEQVRGDGDIGPAADLYSLGQIAYTLLVGAPYWAEERAAGVRVLFDRVEEGAVEPATRRAGKHGMRLAEAFDGWFTRATAVEPEDRFETADAMIQELAAALGTPCPAAPEAKPRLDRRARRWSAWHVAASLAAMGVIGGASWASLRAPADRGGAAQPGVPIAAPPSPASAPATTESSPTAPSPVGPLAAPYPGLQGSPTSSAGAAGEAPPASARPTGPHRSPPRPAASPSASTVATSGPPASPSPYGTSAF